MRPQRVVDLVIWSVVLVLGAVVGIGRDGLLSVQVWLTFAAVGLIATIVARMLILASVEPTRLAAAWRSPLLTRRDRARSSVRGLRATETMLNDAVANPRAHARRLRPRLAELADHYLPIRHGIDREGDPARADHVLGDVAWLVDDSVVDRAPTLTEVDRFMDAILAADDFESGSTATARTS